MTVGKTRKLLVVEDELLLRGLIEGELRALGFDVRAASSMLDARQTMREFDPDIVLLDITLKDGPSGLDFGQLLAKTRPDIAQVYLSKYDSVRSAIGEGAELPAGAGFVSKHLIADTQHLVSVIDQVVSATAAQSSVPPALINRFPRLTPRGIEVLHLLANGASNQSIAVELGITTKAVERWIDIIYKELDISNDAAHNARVQAAVQFHLAVGPRSGE